MIDETLNKLINHAKKDKTFFRELSHDLVETIKKLEYLDDETKHSMIQNIKNGDVDEFHDNRVERVYCQETCGHASCGKTVNCSPRSCARTTCGISCAWTCGDGSCQRTRVGQVLQPLQPYSNGLQPGMVQPGFVQPGVMQPYGYPPRGY
ncbi:hypothetical protein [Desertibacillus haloalkaliphilus]|uniref:hypothetical protein n=1 Tax=Desertibacillus haloalkaliphilus TaxID=1328930 RepID=UPI001C260B89|nr:hypothetical protein [Desertibacillus haloalkaliphilus]MBU8906301.1 hypothetical protein [Desertibacillus haloalkaliphilus]